MCGVCMCEKECVCDVYIWHTGDSIHVVCKGHKKTLDILFYHSLPYSLTVGSPTKPAARMVASKVQTSSCPDNSGFTGACENIPGFLHGC